MLLNVFYVNAGSVLRLKHHGKFDKLDLDHFHIIWIISDCAVLSIQSNDVGAGHGSPTPGIDFCSFVVLFIVN